MKGNEEEDEYEKLVKEEGIWLNEIRKKEDIFCCFVDNYIQHVIFLTSTSPNEPFPFDLQWLIFYFFFSFY